MTDIYNAQGESRVAMLSELPTQDDIEAMRTLQDAKITQLAEIAKADHPEVDVLKRELEAGAASQFKHMLKMQERIQILENALTIHQRGTHSHRNFGMAGS